MVNGWITPTVGLFVVTQAVAAVWWASGTNQKVEDNKTAIEQVVENEKQLIAIQAQQGEIVRDIVEIREDNDKMMSTITAIWERVSRED